MAVGETAGAGPGRPGGSCRRQAAGAAPASRSPRRAAEVPTPPRRPTPLLKEADPEFERLLAEEEEIERSTRDHHETPRFHMGTED